MSKKSSLVVSDRGRRYLRAVRLDHLRGPTRNPTAHFILIHGTWAMEDYDSRWKALIVAISQEHPCAAIWGMHWLAFNTSAVRYVTATIAVRMLRRTFLGTTDAPVYLIGFSHGGSLSTEMMRHPSVPTQWRAVIVGMPLLAPDSMARIAPERLLGGHL